MRNIVRVLGTVALMVLCGSLGWAHPKLDADEMMKKSDAIYYYPSVHGVTDLVCDVVIDRMANDPMFKGMQITYYYAGDDKSRCVITNYPEKYAKQRDELQALCDTLGEYIMPKPSAAAFTGLAVHVDEVTRLIAGRTGTTYYQIVGVPKDAGARGVKEVRVLLDPEGLAYQLENQLQNGASIIASLENVKIANQWHVSKITTRLMSQAGPEWKIDNIAYSDFSGFSLPSKLATQYRNNFGQPVEGVTEYTITFQNYRVNKGQAAAALAAMPEKSVLPAPQELTKPPAPK